MKSSKLWMGIPLIILVFTVVLGVVLTGCDPLPDEDLIVGKWYKSAAAAEAGGQAPFEFTNDSRLIAKSGTATTYYKYKIVGASLEIYDQGGSQKYDDTTPYTVSETELVISKKVGPLGKTTYYRKGSSSSGGQPSQETKAEMPDANPIGATYTSAQTVTLTAETGATIYYTTTGTDPTATTGTKYTTPITISATTTLKAIATKSGLLDSDVMTEVYTISGSTPTPTAPAAPTASPPPGTFTSAQTVTLTAETGASIFYTINGNDPTSSSTPYTTAISVASGTVTIKAIAVKGGLSSDPFSGTYIISSGGGTQSTVNVTSNLDSGANTLRAALTAVSSGGTININLSAGATITLTSKLDITKNVTIKGNGVIITRTSTSANYSLIEVNSQCDVNIERVHFKLGKEMTGGVYGGGAIYSEGSLKVESCIFNTNQGTNGGAISTRPSAGTPSVPAGATTVRGCTFYNNSATNGPAINHASGTLFLTGNLFFKNDPGSTGKVIAGNAAVTSNGYNIVDVALGTGAGQSGWTPVTGEKADNTFTGLGITSFPSNGTPFVAPSTDNFSLNDTKLKIITSAPSGFPTTDFEGTTRTYASPGGVPGAVVRGNQ